MLVLLTNDDGIDASGLAALTEAFAAAGHELAVAAPLTEKSGSSHAVTLHRPLQIDDLGPARWAVHGTPVDCVNVAVNHLLKPRRPDLVISGINRGANLGCDIHYSGTVGAAREACLLGLPSMAVSLQTNNEHPDFSTAAAYAVKLAPLVAANHLPPRTFINVNLPDLPPAKILGAKVTSQGIRIYNNLVQVDVKHGGNNHYTLGGPPTGHVPIPDSDIIAVEAGFVSITPLRLDTTDEGGMEWLKSKIMAD
jgi:5'-nucleotidase